MNAGEIVVHGNVGDACGYAMRGGKIPVCTRPGNVFTAPWLMRDY